MVSLFVTFLFLLLFFWLFTMILLLIRLNPSWLRCASFLGLFVTLLCLEFAVLVLCIHVTGLTAFEGTLVHAKKKVLRIKFKKI